MLFSIEWEKEVYSQNKQINKYPYGEFVSMFFNSLKFLSLEKEKKNIKILELGCGTANNVKFMSELGYDVYGVDGSKSACNIANKFLLNQKINATIIESKFQELPFESDFFDIIIDREAMYCGTFDSIKQSWKEANRVLKKEGLVISFMYTTDNKWCQKANKENNIATKIEKNTFTDFRDGNFKNTGIVHFTEYNELFDFFDFLDMKLINKHGNNTVFSDKTMDFSYDEWIIVGVKK
jgi:SAM-dependent methyltransferase